MKGKILLFLSLALFLFSGLAWGYQVTDIWAQDLEERTRITIVTDCPKYESFAVSEPDRLVIDLEADLLFLDSILVVNKGAVTKVWVSPYRYEDGRQVARVIIGLTQTTPYKVYTRDKELIIDIFHLTVLSDADLIVTNITLSPSSPKAGDKVSCKAVLKNQGGSDTGVFNVKWFLDGEQVGYGSHSNLAPGVTSNGNVYYSWDAISGGHTLKFVADCDNHVSESNETNNSFSKTVKEKPEVEAPKAEAPPERIEEVPEKAPAENHYLKGLTYYKQSEYLKAIEEFKEVPSQAREYKKATKAIAKCQAKLEKTLSEEERAAREVERVREELGKEQRVFYEPYYTQALVHYNKGEWQEMVNACYKVLALDPEHKGAKEYLTKAKGELEEIARVKREEERRKKIKEYYSKGLGYYQKDRLDKAKEEFQQVLVLEPKHAGALDYLGRIEARYRLQKEERRKRKFALAKERKRKELAKKIADYFLAGKTLYEEGKLADARLLFKEVLKLDPKHEKAKEYLAKIEKEKEIKVIPGGAEDHYKQGLIEYDAGHLTKAVEEWKITLRLDPEHEKARIALERAEKELKKIQIAP